MRTLTLFLLIVSVSGLKLSAFHSRSLSQKRSSEIRPNFTKTTKIMSSRSDAEAQPFSNSLKRFAIFNSVIAGLLYTLTRFSTSTAQSYAKIVKIAGVAIGIQWLVFLHAGGILFGNERTEKFYDLTGALTYITCTSLSVYLNGDALSTRQKVLSAFVMIWCTRLGSFLFSRIVRDGHDVRFTAIKPSIMRFLTAWTLQGLWVFITALPVFVLNSIRDTTPIGSLDYVGWGIWLCGFLFEVMADQQKTAFRGVKENKEKFIEHGLWSISRHPNYFGEITLWIGVFISALSGILNIYSLKQLRLDTLNYQFWCLSFSPVFVYLLLNYISGVPMLEKSSEEKFGKIKAYQAYIENTPILVPFIGKRGKA